MTATIPQDRITIRMLRVADWASGKSLCYSAEVLLDGHLVGSASNDGRGGRTRVVPFWPAPDTAAAFLAAVYFAESLHPTISIPDPFGRSRTCCIHDVDIDYLVDLLACAAYAEKKKLHDQQKSNPSWSAEDIELMGVDPPGASAKPPKSYRTIVRSDFEYIDLPEAAEFSIDACTAGDIVRLSRFVRKNDLYKLQRFDYRARYFKCSPEDYLAASTETSDDNFVRTQSDILNVSDTEFWFSADLRNANAEIMSEHLAIADLAEYFAIALEPTSPAGPIVESGR